MEQGKQIFPLNLGAAIAVVGLLTPGVYICMHGLVFDPDGVERVATNGCFVHRDPAAAEDSGSDDDAGGATPAVA